REDRLEGCAIDSATIYSQGSLTDKKYIYMNIDGAISKEQIPNFINQADALYKDIGELEKSLPNTRLIYEKAFAELQSFLAALYNENGSFKEEFSFDIEKVNFFIFKDIHSRAQHIINNMMGRDRINFVESVIKEKISQSNAQENLKYSEEFIRKERQESHNQFDRNLNFKFKDLVHLFDDVDIDKIELKNQLEKIKSFKELYDSALNNFAFDFQNLAGIFKINKESLTKYYQEVKESNEGYEDILQKINELTKEHNKIVKEKAQLVSENKDNLTRNDIQRKLNNFKIDIDKIDDEIRTYQDIVQNYSREKKYKKYKKLSEIILNIITWFDKYPDIVKNITQA
ncbi:type III effector, partial [Escherichia coli]|nr:type III effector [Escherichia coli]